MKKYFIILFTCISLGINAQQINITGRIVSAVDNEPMGGTSVYVKGTTNGTTTDLNGNYSIDNVASDAIVTFSMLGYKTREIPVNGQTVINVQMAEDVAKLDEVVVVGYGVAKRSDLTSSISSIRGADLTTMTTGNVNTSLQGKVPGIQVIAGDGAPGTAPKVLIRGFSTLNLTTDPLYVVDGIPMGNNPNFIDANEIESIEVLKDASAAAIYGSMASNGVIMITTKKGKAGKTVFSADVSYGFQTVKSPFKMANTQEFVSYANIAYQNAGLGQRFDPAEYANTPTTNWWKESIQPISPQISASLGVRGGGDKNLYSVSLNFYSQDDFYRYGGSGGWKRITTRISNDYTFSKYVSTGFMLNPRFESWGSPSNWQDNLRIDPITPVYLPKEQLTGEENEFSIYGRSNLSYVWNPVADNKRNFDKEGYYALGGNAYININPIPELTFKSLIGFDYKAQYGDNFQPDFVIDSAHEYLALNKVSRNQDLYTSYSWQNTLSYLKTFGSHNLNLMVGNTMDRNIDRTLNGSRQQLPNNTEVLREIDAGTLYPDVNGNKVIQSLLSYFGRASYNYDNRYFLTATFRRDGSSKFMTKNKWADFPSASVAWQLVNEKFMKDQSLFGSLKLRAGWGEVGNQNLPAAVYESLLYPNYYLSGSNLINTMHLQTIRNEDIRWETVEDINFGVDFSLLKNILSGSVEYYVKNTKNMLFNNPYPLYSGYPGGAYIWSNVGSMRTKGFEFILDHRNNISKFYYDISLVFTTFNAKATKLAEGASIVYGNSEKTRTEVGMDPAYYYGYVADGIFQNQTEINAHTSQYGDILQPNAQLGDIRFKDLNNDGVLDGNDRTKIGSPWADFTAGLNINLSYSGFDILANFYSSVGNDLVNQDVKTSLYSMFGYFHNVAADAGQKAWHGEGTSNLYPRLVFTDNNENFSKFSSFFVEDGSFLRLKNIQLGYTLPFSVTKKAAISKARFYISGQNLWTLTKFTGVDPEVGGDVLSFGFTGWNYPQLKTILLGVNLTF